MSEQKKDYTEAELAEMSREEKVRLGLALDDVELVKGRDGRDVATFSDDSIRLGRAAYAVMHAVIDNETP